MIKTLAVIGAGGVGAAHLLSAYKAGVRKFVILDTDLKVLDRYSSSTWYNSWADIDDSITVSEDTEVYKAKLEHPSDVYHHLNPVAGELYIVLASPTDTHLEYIKVLSDLIENRVVYEKHVELMLEKPAVSLHQLDELNNTMSQNISSVALELVAERIVVSCEWLFHPLFLDAVEDCNKHVLNGTRVNSTVVFHHPHPPKWVKNQTNVIEDLGTHCAAMSRTLGCGPLDSNLNFGYKSQFETVEIVLYANEETAIYPLTWIPYEEGDLFYRQLVAWFESNSHLYSFSNAVKDLQAFKNFHFNVSVDSL